MAGAGFKTFGVGDVLTASDVNTYLMQQAVMNFADSAARGSAIGTAVLSEGMVSYLADTNAVEVYDGSAWVSVAPGQSGILQVVSTTKTDTFSESSVAGGGLTANVTGLEASITPSATANKVLVTVSIGALGNSTASTGRGAGIVLMRDSTQIAIGDAASNRTRITAAQAIIGTGDFAAVAFSFLDSPSTTSSVTYGVKIYNNSGAAATLYVNRTSGDSDVAGVGRTASTITVQEVAG